MKQKWGTTLGDKWMVPSKTSGFPKARSVDDPFLGTGPTLIACEQSSRHCLASELDPGILAVALERWHKVFPDLKPRKVVGKEATK